MVAYVCLSMYLKLKTGIVAFPSKITLVLLSIVISKGILNLFKKS
jgi:hypothetical protein